MPFKNPFYYTDPFEDTTADLGLPGDTVAEKPVQGNVGISPITTQGAVSVTDQPPSFMDQLTDINAYGTERYNAYTNINNFDPGNRQPGNISPESRVAANLLPRYVDFFETNTDVPFLKRDDNNNLLVMNVGELAGRATLNSLINELYPDMSEADKEALGGMVLEGSPEVGGYYKLVERKADPLGTAVQIGSMAVLSAAAAAGVGAAVGVGTGAGAGAGAGAGTGAAVAAPTITSSITTGLTNAAINTAANAAITEITGGDFEFSPEGFITSTALSAFDTYSSGVRAAADEAYAALNTVDIPAPGSYELYANLNTQANVLDAINNTAVATKAIASGDYVGAFNSLFELGTSAASGFETSGIDAIATLKDSAMDYVSSFAANTFGTEGEWFGANVDDLTNGVMDYAQRIMNGEDPVDALGSAVNEYAKNGGSLGTAGEAARDFIEQAGGEFYNNVIKPVGDFIVNGYEAVASIVPEGGDTPDIVKAIEDLARETGSKAEDAVREAGSFIDEEVLQPTKELVESIYEPLPNPSFDAPNVNLEVNTPEFDLPEFDLPDVDLPDVNLPSLDYEVTPEGSRVARTSEDLKGTSIPRIQQVTPAELFGYTDYLNQLLRG